VFLIGVASAMFLLALAYAGITLPDLAVVVPPPKVAIVDPGSAPGRSSVLFLGDTGPTGPLAGPVIERRGYAYAFEKTSALLSEYGVVVANLETPLTDSDCPSPLRPAIFRYKTRPSLARALKSAGIDAVSLANNHTRDYLAKGLADTMAHLDRASVAHFGAGRNRAEARRGLVMHTADFRLGLLGYMEGRRHWRFKNLSFANDLFGFSWPGVARLSLLDAQSDLARLRHTCDVLVAVVHWGANNQPITKEQERFGRLLIDAGADAVIGHHAHQVQPVELYKGRPIVYGLGNYAFDSRGNQDGMGAALHIDRGKIAKLELIGLRVENSEAQFQPRVARGKDAKRFYERMARDSKKRGAALTFDNDRVYLVLTPGPNKSRASRR
jgi:poly-gamma-glutamate synthesis protein (capsule biosynthesis protein)